MHKGASCVFNLLYRYNRVYCKNETPDFVNMPHLYFFSTLNLH